MDITSPPTLKMIFENQSWDAKSWHCDKMFELFFFEGVPWQLLYQILLFVEMFQVFNKNFFSF
jgi:hypothetical protein